MRLRRCYPFKCLDTDLLIAILRGKKEATEKVTKLDQDEGATTAINAFELYYCANRSERKSENIKEASKMLDRLEVIPLGITYA